MPSKNKDQEILNNQNLDDIQDNDVRENRSDTRFYVPIIVTINSTDYMVSDWSAGGFKLKHFDPNFQVGDCLPIHLSFNFREGIKFSLDLQAEVVWRSSNKRATGFRFLNMRASEKELIEKMGNDIQNGKLTPEEPTINSEKVATQQAIQQTQTPEETQPPKETQTPEETLIPEKKSQPRGKRFWLTSIGLSVVGLAILSATGVALYRAIAYLHIDSAAVARSFKEVVSTHRGKISQLYISQGMEVTAGDPLLRVYDEQMAQFIAEDDARNIQQRIRDKRQELDRVQEKLELTRSELQKAQENLRIARSRQQREIESLEQAKQINQKQLQQAQAQVQALETQYETAQKNLERVKFLEQEGAITEQRRDNAKARLAEIEGKLQQAKQEVEIKENTLKSIEQGKFYTGERFNGDLPQLEAEIEQASETIEQKSRDINIYQRKIKQKQQEIQQLKQQYQNQNFQFPKPMLTDPSEENIFSQVYEAPVDATVSKLKKTVNQPVQMGETLLILEPERDQVMVDAFLTQDQATRVSVGRKAKVTVPDLDLTYQATVTKIDRSGGLRDEIRGRYQFDGSTNRPAYVQLRLLDTTKEDQRLLTPGIPVELTIKKTDF